MLRGFNSDIQARGSRFHVQTEDWGHDNPFLVTRVFKEGAVVKTLKTPYEEALRAASTRTMCPASLVCTTIVRRMCLILWIR